MCNWDYTLGCRRQRLRHTDSRPRAAFRDAVIANATPEDVKLTRDAAENLSIGLLDQVINGEGRLVSLKERGAI